MNGLYRARFDPVAGRRGLQVVAAVVVAMSVLLSSSPASARGSVRLKRTAVQEKNKAWKLKFTIDYGSKPPMSIIPAVFSFKRTVLYERSFTDASGDTPVSTRKVLRNQTPINLPMDLSFGDPASGDIWRKTNFSIKLTRDAEFEAGEYQLTVRLSRGGSLGRTLKLILKGKNKPVDRRAMVFHDNSKSKKKKKKEPAPEEDSGKRKAVEDMGPDLSDIPDVEDDDITEPEGPPKVEPKQGGCGCKTVGGPPPPEGWIGVLIGLGLLLVRRFD